MVKLSRLADYGVVLMSQMAFGSDTVHNAQAVAAGTQLPLPTVSKLLSSLARAGLLVGIRGVKGGFKLARRPEHITIGEIVTAVDGPVALTHCIEHGPGACGVEVFCPTRVGWHLLNDAVRQAFDSVTLADLLTPARPYWPKPAMAGRDNERATTGSRG